MTAPSGKAQVDNNKFRLRSIKMAAALPQDFRWKIRTSIHGFKDRCPAIRRNGIIRVPPARIELATTDFSDQRSTD